MKEEEEEEVCKTMISDLAFNTVPNQKILYNDYSIKETKHRWI